MYHFLVEICICLTGALLNSRVPRNPEMTTETMVGTFGVTNGLRTDSVRAQQHEWDHVAPVPNDFFRFISDTDLYHPPPPPQ